MIHVEQGPAPPDYTRRAEAALQKLISFFARSEETRAQEIPPFDYQVLQPIKDLLLERFYGKCVYCESLIDPRGWAELENYRPKFHYWWLVYDWENLLTACQGCNRAKAVRFPLANESERATRPHEEGRERPLLLNPCLDSPEEHLVFNDDGRVYSDTPRGQATIDILMLNRPGLVEARRAVSRHVLALLDTARPDRSFGSLVKDNAPYAGTARQVLGRALRRRRRLGTPPSWLERVEHGLRAITGTPEVAPKDVAAARSAYEVHEQAVEAFSLPTNESEPVSEHYFAKRRTIERIKIENFKAILDLDINLANTPDGAPSWLMLLGENATGKSSVLKAVALTLMDEKRRRELGLRPDDVLSRGKSEGQVQVWLTGVSKPMKLTYRTGDEAFGGETVEKVLLLGYGSTRLLPRPGMGEVSPQGPVRVSNLFNSAARLVDAEDWLARLEPALFGPAVRVLKALLPLRPRDRLEPVSTYDEGGRPRVCIRLFRTDVSLDELSDGYQAVVALAVDVLSVLVPVWQKQVEMAEGIVLIDELDAHLHPTWRMRMVRTLRECFPHVQFITTSHDPLCLKGLRAGEVVVLRRTRLGRVVAVEDLPSPEGMSVDQLLTSEHFGLGSTVELEVEQIFREPKFKGVWPTGANFAPLSLPDTRLDQSPRPHKRSDDLPGCHALVG